MFALSCTFVFSESRHLFSSYSPRIPHSLGEGAWFACCVVLVSQARFHLRSPNRVLWAGPSPPVGLRLGDLRGGPRLAAGPRLGGRTCPRQSQLASQLLNFPSRALRPPLRQHPCLCIRSAHTHPPLARGGRVVCLLCSPSQSALEVAFTQAATCPVYHREL